MVTFKEGSKVIAWSPALDLSTYGDTEKLAKERFGEAVSIFIDELVEMGTLEDVLEECGWQLSQDKQNWLPPVFKLHDEELVRIPV